MPEIFQLAQIKKALKDIDLLPCIEEGFVAYSQGKVVVPPVGELLFKDPPGDVHIKYGYIIDDDFYVIKIASGFYESDQHHLYTSNGLMLIFSQKTGELSCILLDEGHLTNVRTAVAGAVVAKYLAPKKVHRIGIFGTGTQGRMQLAHLQPIVDCRQVTAWDIDTTGLKSYKKDMEPLGFDIKLTMDAEEVASTCNLIVTATPAQNPLFTADSLPQGTHITAMGSDTPLKTELDPKILERADILVADSISQCLSRGEIHKAMEAGVITKDKIIELGDVITNDYLRRQSDEQLTVADLTGVAVQDIQISKAVYQTLISKPS